MSSFAPKFRNLLRLPHLSTGVSLNSSSKVFFSTGLFDSGDETDKEGSDGLEIEDSDFLPQKPELQLQGVVPKKDVEILFLFKFRIKSPSRRY